MKRPFALIGAVAITASFINLYLGLTLSVIFLILSLIFLAFKNKKSPKGLLILAFLVAFIFSTLFSSYKQSKVEKITGEQVVKAKVISVDEKENYKRITISTRVNSLNFKASLFDTTKQSYTEGDTLTLNAEFSSVSEEMKSYFYSDRIYINGKVLNILEITEGKGLYKGFYHLKRYIENTIINAAGQRGAAPLIAISIGNQDNFDLQTQREIKASGVSHIMVVSGMHLGIICSFLINLLRRAKVRPKTVFLACLMAIVLVLGVCGFHISAIRAALVYLLMLSGLLLRRRADAINSLGFAVFLIALINPQIVGDVSFLLSISATFGVVYITPKLNDILKPKRLGGALGNIAEKLSYAVSLSLSALLCTLPVLIMAFGCLSPVSVIVNVLIAYPVALVLILTTLGIVTSFIPIVGKAFISAAAVLGNYAMWVINLFGSAERFVFYFDTSGKIVFSLLAVSIMFTIIYIDFKNKRKEAQHAD